MSLIRRKISIIYHQLLTLKMSLIQHMASCLKEHDIGAFFRVLTNSFVSVLDYLTFGKERILGLKSVFEVFSQLMPKLKITIKVTSILPYNV